MSKRNAAIRKSLAATEGQIFEKFDRVDKKPAKSDIAYIVMCLKIHFVFSSLSEV
jgi:hypothetical protein